MADSPFILDKSDGSRRPLSGEFAPEPIKYPLVGLMAHYDDLDNDLVSHISRNSKLYFDGNAPKWNALLQPGASSIHDYDFTTLDAVFDVADGLGILNILHTLIWSKLDFFPDGYPVGDQAQRMIENETHIRAILDRYLGRLFAVQVWNEPVALDGSGLKGTFGIPDISLDEVGAAFVVARDAAPGVPLGLNEHTAERAGAKQTGYLNLAKDLMDGGYPLDFMGLQCHLNVDDMISYSEFMATFAAIADLGLDVHLTELDIRIGTAAGTIAEKLVLQATLAKDLAAAVVNSSNVKVITPWGPHNGLSWIYDKYGIAYPDEQPLPFESDFTATAFWESLILPIKRIV